MKIRGILFDLDGTLIDTIDLIIQAFEHSFAVCLNKKMPRAELVKYFGLPLRSAMENYVDKNQVETLCAVYREFNLKYHDELIKPFPGVKETLSVLQQRGIKMAVVTSKKVPMAKRGLQCMGLETYIEAVIGCDICQHHKPHPEPMEKALSALKLKADSYTSFDWHEMLDEGNPTYILKEMPDLIKIIDDLNNKH